MTTVRKIFLLAMIYGLSGISSAIADPSVISITFNCPSPTTGIKKLTHFGNRIAGFGTKIVPGEPPASPFFNYFIPFGANIPSKLSNGAYVHSGTDYDSLTGVVSCSYVSGTSYDPFTVTYNVINGTGSLIASQSLDSITISQFLGYKKNS